MSYRSQTWVREKSGKIIVPLDTLRTMDTGFIVSFGGALASATLYSAQSGQEVYLRNLVVQPFSGYAGAAGHSVGYIRLLDGATYVTPPILVATFSGGTGFGPQTNAVVGGLQIPVQPGRFLSSINIEATSSVAFPFTVGGLNSGVFAGSVYAEVIIDPKPHGE